MSLLGKYLGSFWRTLVFYYLWSQISLILTWSSTCIINNLRGRGTFAKTDTKLYVPIVILSTQDNLKLREQLNYDFKRTINWNKCISRKPIERQNPYLYYLINPSFQAVTRVFIVLFENESDRRVLTGYYLPKVEIEDYNFMIDGKNLFDQPVTKDFKNLKKHSKIVF